MIARLEQLAAYGVADYVWSLFAADHPGLSLLEVGEARFARKDTEVSYRRCCIAERLGEPAGMMFSYPMGVTDPELEKVTDPVLEPFHFVETADIYHISTLGVFERHQGHGIGTALIAHARSAAAAEGLRRLSLEVFAENEGAYRLYEREGFTEVARHALVPHPLIKPTGDLVLMLAEI